MKPKTGARISAVILTGVLAALTRVAAQVPTTADARIDVDGTKEGIPLFVVAPPAKGTGLPATWYAETEKNRQYLSFQAPTSASEWREIRFSFMALKTGKVRLSLRGAWYKVNAEIAKVWVLYDDVAAQNAIVANGDFEAVANGGPAAWWLNKRDGFLAVHHQDSAKAHQGKGCIEVCHDLDGAQEIAVQANTTVTLSAWHRRGE
jgi:hypothetical protein